MVAPKTIPIAPHRAGSNRLKLTIDRIAKLPQPESGRLYHYDTATPGLTVCVTAAGARTYYLYKKINGRPARVRLGTVDELSLDRARKMAQKMTGDIADGQDPQADRMAKRGEMRFGALFDHYLEQHAKPFKKTWREDELQFNRYLSGWKTRKLTAIRRADVQSLHAAIGKKHGHYAANRMRGLIHVLFAKAALDVGFEGPNPAAGVKKFREQSRQRFLQADELPRFFEALEGEPNVTIRDYFKVLLLAGQRRTNTLEMRWRDVHLDRGTWEIPMTKSGEPFTAYLPAPVIEILTRRKAETAGEWVFPGHVGGQHLKDPTKNWRSICTRANLENLRPHDLRRTLGSWQAATGASLPIIGKTLGHKSQSATAVYARLNLDPVRQAIDTATTAILAAAQPQKSAKRRKVAK